MKIFALLMVIFMKTLKRPVMYIVFCKMIENGCCVYKRLLTSKQAINYILCSLLFWSIALLWILINYRMTPNIIFVMILPTDLLRPSTLLSLL